MARNKEMSASQLDAKLKEFETKLKRLYRTYEQYFIGVENRPPQAQRRQLERLYRELDQLPKMKTSHKFRFRNLVQKYNSYKAYWNRVVRQIEQGTYHRDVARAKARQERREEREKEQEEVTADQSEDGAFEIDDEELADLDLESLEEELADMDDRGEFEKYVATAKVKREGFPEDERPEASQQRPEAAREESAPDQSGDWSPPEPDESVKEKRLAELQEKLGLSGRGAGGSSKESAGGDAGQNPFERGNQEATKKARPENPNAPSRGADMSKLRKLRRAKERIEREQRNKQKEKGGGSSKRRERKHSGRNRVIRRDSSAGKDSSNKSRGSSSRSGGSSSEFTEEKSRKIYNNLVEAKRRCNEDTSNLNYDSFKKTMDRQRTRIQKKKGARNVDFKVVIKDGSAFLKPETDD
ncbi:MAG: MXAN_5187 C-terminal domain-containing protein [Persicimonas sp.]